MSGAPALMAVSAADFGWIVLSLFLMFLGLSLVVLSLTWLERKVLARLQRRLGPTRSGPMGLMQPLADAFKLLLKEDIVPASANRAIFWAAPLIVVVSAFMIWVTIPGARDAAIRNLDLGLFYIIAFAVLGILGLVLAGWGSANKYGRMGGLRAAAQLISYEIPIIMVAVSVAMLAESLDVREIVAGQGDYPYLVLQPLGLVIFFIAGLAEVGRTPFDIYYAESELVGGPFVEYSGAHWSAFFMAEYINTYAVILVIFWVRGTFPRLRIDQLMAFAWKVMVPLSFFTIVMTAVYRFYNLPAWSMTLMSLAGLAVVVYLVYRRMTGPYRLAARVRARQELLRTQRTAS